MLIDAQEVFKTLKCYNINPKGVLHIGAHECEELGFYTDLLKNQDDTHIVWIDAVDEKVVKAKERGILTIYQAVVSDKDNEEIIFHMSQNSHCHPDNCESSSILNFGLHSLYHPQVRYVKDIKMTTITIDTFFDNNNLNHSLYDFWNLDIQGAELLALRGSKKFLKNFPPKAIYIEVNQQELYLGCGLLPDVDDFLKEYGFKRVLLKMTDCGWGDALYIQLAENVHVKH